MLQDFTSPSFIRLLANPAVKTVAICGTGGGFDFMHCAHFFPLLRAANKKVIIHSFSFGDPNKIQGALVVDPKNLAELASQKISSKTEIESLLPSNEHAWPKIVIADAKCRPDRKYGPEVALASFLDQEYESPLTAKNICKESFGAKDSNKHNIDSDDDQDDNQASKSVPEPHWVYASYARNWTPMALRNFYQLLAVVHDVDAFLCIDGGSDSLQKGNEEGLGDPVEDATTVAAIASLPERIKIKISSISQDQNQQQQQLEQQEIQFVPIRILVALGFGCDRFNGCSDEDGFKAIAELSALARGCKNEIETSVVAVPGSDQVCGFLGSMAMERFSEGSMMYAKLINFTQDRFSFRSVIANSIIETAQGAYGSETVPESLKARVPPGSLHLWPLMSFAFAFDVRLMNQRSMMCPLLMKCRTVEKMYSQLSEMRKQCGRPSVLW